jgi:hypothetical protein
LNDPTTACQTIIPSQGTCVFPSIFNFPLDGHLELTPLNSYTVTFPLCNIDLFKKKILPKSQLVWGYYKEGEGNGWVEVNVKEVDMTIPEGVEKKIGFEGVADPPSGYYCVYKEGRMVTGSEKQSGVQQGRGVGPSSGKSFTSKKKIGE